jgi:hypothetical protein
MLFSVICRDIDDGFELRKQTRPAHLAFLASQEVRFAGPMLSDDETKPIGSIVIIDCTTLDEANAIAAADPYNLAGLFSSVNVHPFKQVIPEESP